MNDFFIVSKVSGSQYARVLNARTGVQLARFDILKGHGSNNGWEKAKAYAAQLNRIAEDKTVQK